MPRGNPRTPITVRIDTDTKRKVDALLRDPIRGRTRYSSLSNLIDRLLLDFVLQETIARKANS